MPISAMAAHGGLRSIPRASGAVAGVGGAARIVWTSLTAAALERLVSEETQERHHDPRHPAAAAATAGLRLAAWAVLHALDDIAQSHVCLLNAALILSVAVTKHLQALHERVLEDP